MKCENKVTLEVNITTVFVDKRLLKRKHPRKRFQNFRQSCVLSRSEGHTSGCDWWISIQSVDNMHDWRKFGNVSAGVLFSKVAYQRKRW